jgi:outer membrane protein assembly factor BamB
MVEMVMMKLKRKLAVGLAMTSLVTGLMAQQPGDKLLELNLAGEALTPALAPDGSIVVALQSLFGGVNRLMVLNPDGSLKWERDLAVATATSPVVDAEGRIYIGTLDMKMAAYDPEGTKLWDFPMGSQVFPSPAVGADGRIYLGTLNNNTVYALDAEGTIQWQYAVAGWPYISPVIGHDGGIFIATQDMIAGYGLVALTSEGVKRWQTNLSGTPWGMAVGEGNLVYVATTDGALISTDSEGRLEWEIELGGVLGGPVIGLDGTIYVPSNEGMIHAINPDGSRKWAFADEGQFGPAALARDGTIYFASNRMLYCLGPDGRKRWSQPIGHGTRAPLLVEDRIYIGDHQRLHVFQASSALAESPWPLYQADPQRTGRGEGRNAFTFREHPQNQVIPELGQARFSVALEGEGFDYQWRHNGVDLPGATQPSLLIDPVRMEHAGEYQLIVTHAKGISASGPALLELLPVAPFVERRLPEAFYPGAPFLVVLEALPPDSITVYAVEDGPPGGWKVHSVSQGGSYDAVTHKVKFGPFFDSAPRTLSYQVEPLMEGDAGVNLFEGISSVEGIGLPVSGENRISFEALLHPADNGPADNRISIDEVTAYGSAWRRGGIWPIEPNPIRIEFVTRAAALWKGGERYFYTSHDDELVLRWVNQSELPAGRHSRHFALQEAENPPAVSLLPLDWVSGEWLPVLISVNPAASVSAYAVEERIPPGWEAAHITQGGVLDQVNGLIKWGPFLDADPRELRYEIRPPAETDETGALEVLEGTVSFDGKNVVITGTRIIRAGLVLRLKSRTSGPLELHLGGAADAAYRIEFSQDLEHWQDWGFAEGNSKVDLPRPSEPGGLFFRAVLEEGPAGGWTGMEGQ